MLLYRFVNSGTVLTMWLGSYSWDSLAGKELAYDTLEYSCGTLVGMASPVSGVPARANDWGK
jgi:hypothetical protein